jgi:hypothetical protein
MWKVINKEIKRVEGTRDQYKVERVTSGMQFPEGTLISVSSTILKYNSDGTDNLTFSEQVVYVPNLKLVILTSEPK